jgi:hypothetical protein
MSLSDWKLQDAVPLAAVEFALNMALRIAK